MSLIFKISSSIIVALCLLSCTKNSFNEDARVFIGTWSCVKVEEYLDKPGGAFGYDTVSHDLGFDLRLRFKEGGQFCLWKGSDRIKCSCARDLTVISISNRVSCSFSTWGLSDYLTSDDGTFGANVYNSDSLTTTRLRFAFSENQPAGSFVQYCFQRID